MCSSQCADIAVKNALMICLCLVSVTTGGSIVHASMPSVAVERLQQTSTPCHAAQPASMSTRSAVTAVQLRRGEQASGDTFG
mmetsp:Transcript_6154/g.10688  ORF Transcript_6154/g.10688 Transcript_6154/m.10688 type:complete len:82 (-) Transcript_6154:838-1083(-)